MATQVAKSRDYYLYYNGHGDLAAEADASGARTALHTYNPFGAPLYTQPADPTSTCRQRAQIERDAG